MSRCRYCGAEIIDQRRYCQRCVSAGFGAINEITGRTNGWDRARPPRPDEQDADGWRGQRCMGGRAADRKSKNE